MQHVTWFSLSYSKENEPFKTLRPEKVTHFSCFPHQGRYISRRDDRTGGFFMPKYAGLAFGPDQSPVVGSYHMLPFFCLWANGTGEIALGRLASISHQNRQRQTPGDRRAQSRGSCHKIAGLPKSQQEHRQSGFFISDERDNVRYEEHITKKMQTISRQDICPVEHAACPASDRVVFTALVVSGGDRQDSAGTIPRATAHD